MDENTEFQSLLAGDQLLLNSELGLGQYTQPPHTLTVRVDSEQENAELLFFPFDADESFKSIKNHPCTTVPPVGQVCDIPKPDVPAASAVGFIHQPGVQTVPIGSLLDAVDGAPRGIDSLYMRKHGECERAVAWKDLLTAVLSQVKGGSDCEDTWLGCFDYTISIYERIATSYLRKPDATRGRGGFGLYMRGRTEFDSPFVCDLDFKGKAGYDATLSSDGLPVFSVSAGPFTQAYNCSSSPGCTCKNSQVADAIASKLKDTLPGSLNKTVNECLAVKADTLGPSTCEAPYQCSNGSTANFLGDHAAKEAKARGASDAVAAAFEEAMHFAANWTCAKVKPECAVLTGSEPTDTPVCQVKLRPRDVVPMPDSLSLVWYQGGLGGTPPTAAEALYLALTDLKQTDKLAALCGSPDTGFLSGLRVRAFVKVAK